MSTTHLNPSGADIQTCDDDKSCELLTCDVCLIEIPADLAKNAETPDYVHHFCGLDCLDKWRGLNKGNAK